MTSKLNEDMRKKVIEGVKANSEKYGFPTKKKDELKKKKMQKTDS